MGVGRYKPEMLFTATIAVAMLVIVYASQATENIAIALKGLHQFQFIALIFALFAVYVYMRLTFLLPIVAVMFLTGPLQDFSVMNQLHEEQVEVLDVQIHSGFMGVSKIFSVSTSSGRFDTSDDFYTKGQTLGAYVIPDSGIVIPAKH